MCMSDHRVLSAMATGRVLIDPFVPANLKTSSYDVTLGPYFYREQVPSLPGAVFNIYDPEHVGRVWGSAQAAQPAREVLGGQYPCTAHLSPDSLVIMLEPGETILAHTREFIGGRHDVTTMMKARSSLRRSFVSVCQCAGWGDVGYVNRWTMEVTNCSQHYRVPLLVGSRVAQIVFLETGPVRSEEYGADGAYQSGHEIERIKAGWTPEMMLPRVRP